MGKAEAVVGDTNVCVLWAAHTHLVRYPVLHNALMVLIKFGHIIKQKHFKLGSQLTSLR